MNSRPCRYFRQGFCKFGARCKFSHDLCDEDSDEGPNLLQQMLLLDMMQKIQHASDDSAVSNNDSECGCRNCATSNNSPNAPISEEGKTPINVKIWKKKYF